MDVLFLHLGSGQDSLLLFQGVRRIGRRRGWRVLSRAWYGAGTTPIEPGCDGIIAQVGLPAMGAQLAALGVPVVNCDGSIPGAFGFPTVRHDGAAVGRVAARHLLDLGLRRLAYAGPADRRNADEQEMAVRDAAATAGAAFASWRWAAHGPNDAGRPIGGGLRPLEAVVERLGTPLGLVVWGVMHPVQVCDLLRQRWRIPQEVAVIATAHDPLLHGGDEGISAVRTVPERIGEAAAALLAERLAGRRPRDVRIAPQGVVDAASTSTLAVAHPVVAAAMRHLARHAHRPVTVDEVADAVSTSRRTLQRLFRQVLGHGIREAALRLRCQHATRLLDDGQTVKAVAHRLGFASGSHLARTLRRLQEPASRSRRRRDDRRHGGGSRSTR